MKKILIILLCPLIVYIIFILANDNSINYVSIGDSSIKGINQYNIVGYGYNDYVKNYLIRNNLEHTFNNYYFNSSIDGLKNDVQNNKILMINNHQYSIKKVLRESDLLVISTGMDELNFYLTSFKTSKFNDLMDSFYEELDSLCNIIKKYAKNDIIFIGLYNPKTYYDSDIDEFFYNLETNVAKILKKYDISYLKMYEKVKGGNYIIDGNHHLSTKGYLMVAQNIIAYIEKM